MPDRRPERVVTAWALWAVLVWRPGVPDGVPGRLPEVPVESELRLELGELGLFPRLSPFALFKAAGVEGLLSS